MHCALGIAHAAVALADVAVGEDVVAAALVAVEMFQDVEVALNGKYELPLACVEIARRLPGFLHEFLVPRGFGGGDLQVEIYLGGVVGATVGVSRADVVVETEYQRLVVAPQGVLQARRAVFERVGHVVGTVRLGDVGIESCPFEVGQPLRLHDVQQRVGIAVLSFRESGKSDEREQEDGGCFFHVVCEAIINVFVAKVYCSGKTQYPICGSFLRGGVQFDCSIASIFR